MEMIDKAAVVAEINRRISEYENCGIDNTAINAKIIALQSLLIYINTLEVRDPYERCVQYQSVEAGIKAHAETYSFNVNSELFPQLTKEQQKLWRKEIEYACISGGDMGYILAKDLRYKENHEVKETNLEEYINELSKQFPDVSFAKLSRIAVRVAKWQKQHLWKYADGDDLPEIDREVIALLDNGKVVFAHRPSEYWDGKDIVTGKVTRNYPKTYDKGGWNSPNIKWWLDLELPCGGRTISKNYTDKNKEQAK